MLTGEACETPRAYKDIGVGQLLALLARDYPQNDALIYPDRGLRYDFSQLEWLSRKIARGLLSLGIETGDRVAVWAPNVPEWVVLQFALAKIGAVLVTVNTSLRTAEIEYLLKQSESSTLITVAGVRDIDYVATIYEVVPELLGSEEGALLSVKLPFLRNVIYIGGGTAGGAVIGGAIGGAKGAGIGAIIGAGAGVAGVMLTKGNEAELRSGAEIGMLTSQPITFSVRSER